MLREPRPAHQCRPNRHQQERCAYAKCQRERPYHQPSPLALDGVGYRQVAVDLGSGTGDRQEHTKEHDDERRVRVDQLGQRIRVESLEPEQQLERDRQ